MDTLTTSAAEDWEAAGARRESENDADAYAHLIDGLPGLVFVADAAGRLVGANTPLRELTGAELGRDWREVLDADDRARVDEATASAFAAGDPVRFEAGISTAQSKPATYSFRLIPARSPGDAVCWIGVGREAEVPANGPSPAALAGLVEAQAAIAAAAGDAGVAFAIVAKAALSVVCCADGAAIQVLEGDRLAYRAASGVITSAVGNSIALRASLAGLTVEQRRPLVSDDCEADPRVDQAAARRFAVRSMITAPLFRNGRPFGVLKIVAATPHAFSQTDVVLAQLLVGALDLGLAGTAEREASHARRLSDAALDASEAQFHTTADALPGLLFVTSSEGKNIYVNRGYCDFTGRGAQDLLGDRWVETLHREDAEHAKELWQAATRTGQLYEAEYRFRRHDGEWRWHLVRALPVKSADGGIETWVGCCIDIHERRQSEDELQRRIAEGLAERRVWAEIVDAVDTSVQVVSPDLRILATNRANVREWERQHGVRPQAGDRLEDLYATQPTLLQTAVVFWRRVLAGESFSYIQPCDDGANPDKWYEMKYNPIYGADGRLIGALRFGDDVTERLREQRALSERTEDLNRANARLQAEMKRREEAQAALVQAQKLEALGRLTSGIAHDFNNVTQAVAGGFAIIEKRTKDPGIAEIARHGAAAAHRGGHLVKQLLAFARQQVLTPQRVELHSQLAETAPLLAHTVGPAVEMTLDCPADLPPARVDPSLLETALLNLAANARDAMPDGGRLTVRAQERRPGEPGHPAELAERRAIAIVVADTGQGMSARVLERALEPFFTTKGPGRGAGLGLAMVHGFVRQSSGALAIESREGEGTTVTLFLPCDERSETASSPAETARPPSAASPAMTILLVDDDDAVRNVTAAQLSELGHRVAAADGVAAAVELFERNEIDMVVSDVVMADADGLALAETLRRRRPNVPLLFITGHADRARLAGEHVLDKPFSLAALAEALRQVTAQRDRRRPEAQL